MARRAISHYNTLTKNRSRGELAVYQEFGRRLQARMIQLGWNQSDLARYASDHLPKTRSGKIQGHAIGRDRISSYIRGLYLPRPEALVVLARALECLPEDLLPPSASVPSVVAEEGPLMEFKGVGDHRVAIRLNRVVSEKTALAIHTLLAEEDK